MKQQPLLKKQQFPNNLLTKNKKTNSLIENHYLKSKIKHERNKISSLLHNFEPGFMQPQYQGDQTLKVKQKQIASSTNIQTASNMFDLELAMGNYNCEFSSNGSTLMLTSNKGHLAILKWRQKQLLLENNFQQQVLDSRFLHNDEMFALCQRDNLYVYDNRGIQLHKLDKSLGVQYLPHHFLLVGYDNRKLKYYDTTTGYVIADHHAKNNYTVMKQNHSNAIIALGNNKGVVEWWTPGVGLPAVKLFAGASITDIAFHKGYMFTASDNVKVWDSRMLKILYQYPLHRRLVSLSASQTGLLSLNYGFKLEIFRDSWVSKQTHPYMIYKSLNTIMNTKFIPYQDVLGMGTNKGFSSIVVPGSGSPYYDTFQINPFETKKQKRQSLVHKLLEKLPPQTIVIDPNTIGNIDKTGKQILEKQEQQSKNRQQKEELQKRLKKKKSRGKSKIGKKLDRKVIQLEKKRRQQLTKVINTKLWSKWAEKKKKQSQLQLIQQMEEQGINLSSLPKKKTKKIAKN